MSDPDDSAVFWQTIAKATNTPASTATSAKAKREKEKAVRVIAKNVSGKVKWYNAKVGYGFITRNDTKEDIYVHRTAFFHTNRVKDKHNPGVGEGELVEFDLVAGEKGSIFASNVTGPGGKPVKGSPYSENQIKMAIIR